MAKDGGPAYPVIGEPLFAFGMSLRDWFAGQALGAVIEMFDTHSPNVATHQNFAKEAYRIADAMLAEREKQ